MQNATSPLQCKLKRSEHRPTPSAKPPEGLLSIHRLSSQSTVISVISRLLGLPTLIASLHLDIRLLDTRRISYILRWRRICISRARRARPPAICAGNFAIQLWPSTVLTAQIPHALATAVLAARSRSHAFRLDDILSRGRARHTRLLRDVASGRRATAARTRAIRFLVDRLRTGGEPRSTGRFARRLASSFTTSHMTWHSLSRLVRFGWLKAIRCWNEVIIVGIHLVLTVPVLRGFRFGCEIWSWRV